MNLTTEQIADRMNKGFTAIQIAKEIGCTRQNLYARLSKDGYSQQVIKKWAKK